MSRTLVAYGAVTRLARGLAAVAAHGSPGLRQALEARARSAAELAGWAQAHRDPTRPLLLFHAASAGELRQAEPVIRRVRSRHPEWQLAITTFSPSGAKVAAELPVDVAGLLPWDTRALVSAFLDALTPTAIVVSKLDLWPMLARLAGSRQIRLCLIAGTVRARSGRLRWPARMVLAEAYAALDLAAAVSPEDAVRLTALGTRPERIVIAGDPRYDAVVERLTGAPTPVRDQATLVAGSTWARDEEVLLLAFRGVLRATPSARLLIAPHQPSARALARIDGLARRLGLPPARRLTEAGGIDRLVVVDTVGQLAFLYGSGVIAYVGGGFGRAGLHSVLEPAAWGVPIIAGPGAGENPDALRLVAAHALEQLPTGDPAGALERAWGWWLEKPVPREQAGAAARQIVEAGTGAADRSAELVEQLVEKQPATSRRPPLRS
jgi:3-deoxy-D-manno-octulosonic-acid transferase